MMNQTVKLDYETVIGLEVHLQLSTQTKIFCGCANIFGNDPNSQTCPVCLGLPGTLPVLNKKTLLFAIRIASALNCKINPFIKFDRKNYYYPDLPKGYQISQFDLPIAEGGFLMIHRNKDKKKIQIKRAHLEEDAGKLIHDNDANCSLVDYNRTGTPLMEIVTEPDLRSSQEAYDYLQQLKLTLQYLDVSDCDMEKGSLRCDANISVREKGTDGLGTKTELKNMNSFKAVKSALEFERNRHVKTLQAGNPITQETRLWDEAKAVTITMRSKEEDHDYRYFPEPDLVPFLVEEKTIKEIKAALPELPEQKLERLLQDYKLSDYDGQILIQDRHLADFFEECVSLFPETKKICNWINGPLLKEVNKRKIKHSELAISPQKLVSLIKKVDEGELSNLAAKEVFALMIDSAKDLDEIIKEKGLQQVSDDSTLDHLVEDVVSKNETIVEQIKSGKESAVGFLVGQAMRKSQGKANPKKIGEMIRRRILHE